MADLGWIKLVPLIISENLARASSFALSIGAHVGIGTLPIVFFGTHGTEEKVFARPCDRRENRGLLLNGTNIRIGCPWGKNNGPTLR